jgi:hypothetical protein
MIPNADGPPRHHSPHGPLAAVLAEPVCWRTLWPTFTFAADGRLFGYARELAYANEFTKSEVFLRICAYGHLKAAQWLLGFFESSHVDVRSYANYDVFQYACMDGHLEIAQWLWEIYLSDNDFVTIDAFEVNMTVRYTCEADRLEIVRWLLSADIIPLHQLTDICRPKSGDSRAGPKITAWFNTQSNIPASTRFA